MYMNSHLVPVSKLIQSTIIEIENLSSYRKWWYSTRRGKFKEWHKKFLSKSLLYWSKYMFTFTTYDLWIHTQQSHYISLSKLVYMFILICTHSVSLLDN